MLQAKTEEQKTHIEDVILKDVFTWLGDGVCWGIHIDDYVTFDQMKQIVEFLEQNNKSV